MALSCVRRRRRWRERVAAFDLDDAATHRDGRFGEIGAVGHQRFVEIGPAFEARAVTPLQQRSRLAAFGIDRRNSRREYREECRSAARATSTNRSSDR